MPNKIKYAFRMVHIKNMPYILNCGFVTAKSQKADPGYITIGDSTVIEKRKRPIQGYKLNDFIPFYFGPRSPMLYVIQHGFNNVKKIAAQDIVYCVIRIDDIIKGKVECVFTDGHAMDSLSNFYTYENLCILDEKVRYKDVFEQNWANNEYDPI